MSGRVVRYITVFFQRDRYDKLIAGIILPLVRHGIL